jgi:hypothetical protein
MATPTLHHARQTFTFSLWLGVLGSPIAFLVHLQLLYLLVVPAQKSNSYFHLYLTTSACLLVAVICGVLSYWDLRCVHVPDLETRDTATGTDAGRTRFVAWLGILSGILFSLAILAAGIAPLFLKAKWG